MDRDAVKWREMVGGDDRAFLDASEVLKASYAIEDDAAFLDLVFEIEIGIVVRPESLELARPLLA